MLDSTFNSVQQGYLSAVFFYFYIYIRCLRKPEKGKSMVRLGLNFCLFRVKLIFWYNKPLSSFVELLSIKSYNIATANLCIDHGLTTKNRTVVFYYEELFDKIS